MQVERTDCRQENPIKAGPSALLVSPCVLRLICVRHALIHPYVFKASAMLTVLGNRFRPVRRLEFPENTLDVVLDRVRADRQNL